ncbi:hypothetical protein Tco_1169974 [Tanacetum coccineum]
MLGPIGTHTKYLIAAVVKVSVVVMYDRDGDVAGKDGAAAVNIVDEDVDGEVLCGDGRYGAVGWRRIVRSGARRFR